MFLLSLMKVFRVLSTAFVRILLFATCHTSALSSSWHVFTVLLAYIRSWVFVVQKFQMCYSSSADFLVCINIAPRNNGCGAREFLKLLLWIFREIWYILKTLPWNRAFFPWIRLVPIDDVTVEDAPSHVWKLFVCMYGTVRFLTYADVIEAAKQQTWTRCGFKILGSTQL